jgi:DNA-3-methyladenine glycosylase II
MATTELWDKARNHLRRRDEVLRPIIKTVGACKLQPISDLFAALVYSIVSQQISTKAAASIRTRLVNEACRGTLSPAALLRATEEELRLAGLSTSKRRSMLDLAGRVDSGSLKLEELRKLPDEEVIEQLIPVHGIGRWTAQMFLIFSLGRPDVLPVDDFGLKTAVQRCYGLSALPDRTTIEEKAEPWRPWCSIATWYLWRSLDARPKSSD